LIGIPKGKGQLGRPSRRWLDNVKVDVGEIGWSSMDWLRIGNHSVMDQVFLLYYIFSNS
jgi:hypothetical protein